MLANKFGSRSLYINIQTTKRANVYLTAVGFVGRRYMYVPIEGILIA